MGTERPSVTFDLATARLAENQILLPGASTLERLVAAVRDRAQRRAQRRAWVILAAAPNPTQRVALRGC